MKVYFLKPEVRRTQMKRLIFLMLMGSLMAQNLPTGLSQPPKTKTPFQLHYEDIENYRHLNLRGSVLVRFRVNKKERLRDQK